MLSFQKREKGKVVRKGCVCVCVGGCSLKSGIFCSGIKMGLSTLLIERSQEMASTLGLRTKSKIRKIFPGASS